MPLTAARAAAPAKPSPATVRLAWDQPSACNGWSVEQSPDLRTWAVVTNLGPGYAGGVTSPPVIFTPPAFWRVGAY